MGNRLAVVFDILYIEFHEFHAAPFRSELSGLNLPHSLKSKSIHYSHLIEFTGSSGISVFFFHFVVCPVPFLYPNLGLPFKRRHIHDARYQTLI